MKMITFCTDVAFFLNYAFFVIGPGENNLIRV